MHREKNEQWAIAVAFPKYYPLLFDVIRRRRYPFLNMEKDFKTERFIKIRDWISEEAVKSEEWCLEKACRMRGLMENSYIKELMGK
jgi:hypothetical protein